MGKINVYKSIGTKYDVIDANGKLTDILKSNGIDISKCVKIVNAKRVDDSYIVKDDDIVFVRVLPYSQDIGMGSRVALGILTGGIFSAIYEPILANNQKKARDEAESKRLQKMAQEKAQKIETSAFLKGGSNKNALGNHIPYLIGLNYVTPYLLTNGRFGVYGGRGEAQYWDAIFCVAYKDIVIKEVLVGNASVCKFEGDVPQNGKFKFNVDSPYNDKNKNNFVEIRQGNSFESESFNWAVTATQSGEEIVRKEQEDSEEVVRPIVQVEGAPMRIEVCIQFNGLRQYYETGQGHWGERISRIVPDWSNDGGVTWHEFNFYQPEKNLYSNEFRYNSNKQIRFVASYDFNYSDVFDSEGNLKNIQVRCTKNTPDAKNFTTNENCYLMYVNAYQFDVQMSKKEKKLVKAKILESDILENVTLMAMHIESNQNTSDKLENIHVIANGTARVWDSYTQKWSSDKKPTSNPSAWVLDVMTSPLHRLSCFRENEIDLQNFGKFYEFCEEHSFCCDGGVEKAIKKRSLLENILLLADAALVYDASGLYQIKADYVENIPVALLNAQDVKDIKVTKDFSRKPDGMKVSWKDRTAWQEATRYVMFNGNDYKMQDETVQEQTIEYCINAEHAWKIAQRRLRKMKLQPRDVVVEVGDEGAYYPLFSTVKLQTEQLKIGLASSTIHKVRVNDSGFITAIEIGDLVEFVNGSRYGVIIQAQDDSGKELIHAEVIGSGKTRTLEFSNAYKPSVMPTFGNVLSFGLIDLNNGFERITNVMKIYDIKPNDKGYTLTLKDYDRAIFEYDDVIPEYYANLTSLQEGEEKTIPDVSYNTDKTDTVVEAIKMTKKNALPYAYMESYGYVFFVDSDNNPENACIRIPIHVVKGEEELPFFLGKINAPEGLKVTEYFEGKKHGIQIETVKSDEVRNITERVQDEITGFWHDIVIDTFELNKQIGVGMFDVPIVYTNNYTKKVFGRDDYTLGRNYVFGRDIPTNEMKRVVFKFSYSTSRAGCYRGMKNDLTGFLSTDINEQIKENLHIGDFFTWSNVNNTSENYNGKLCEFVCSCVYRWNGKYWEEDNSTDHNAAAMTDIFAIAKNVLDAGNEGQIENSQAMSFFDTLASNKIFCKQLTANKAFIEMLFTNKIVLNHVEPTLNEDGNVKEAGFIESVNFNNIDKDEITGEEKKLKGFRISSNGKAEFYELVVSGTTALRGDTIAANKALIVPRCTNGEVSKQCRDEQMQIVMNQKSASDIYKQLLWCDSNGKLWFGGDRILMGSDLSSLFSYNSSTKNININTTGLTKKEVYER